jgi:hypothetical protein
MLHRRAEVAFLPHTGHGTVNQKSQGGCESKMV